MIRIIIFIAISSEITSALRIEGNHLRAIGIHNPPYDIMKRFPNGTVTFVGGGSIIGDWWARRFNITIAYIYPEEEHFKRRGLGAAVDLLINDEADISTSGFSITPDRLPLVDYSTFPSWHESTRLVVPRPKEKSRLFAFARPFDSIVWLLMGITMLLTIVLMTLMERTKLKGDSTPSTSQTVGVYALYVVSTLTNHGDFVKMPLLQSFTVLVTAWLLGVSVLVYVYSSIIVSSLTAPQFNPSIDSFDDLLKSQEVAPLIRTDIYIGLDIMNSESGTLKQLAVKAKKYPKSLSKDAFEIDERLSTGRYAFPFLETFVRVFIANQQKKDGKCNFQESKPLSEFNSYFFIILTKRSRHTRIISLSLMEMWETGIGPKWKMDMLPPGGQKCQRAGGSSSTIIKERSIKLNDLASAFFILGVGFSISLTVFIFEIVFAKK